MTKLPSAAPVPSSPKILAAPTVKLGVAAISGLLLAAGAWLAPAATPATPPAPQEHAAPLLEEQVPPREIPRPFQGVQDLPARAREQSVTIPASADPPPTRNDFEQDARAAGPRGAGAIVDGQYVLTHADALRGGTSTALITANDERVEGQVAAYEPETGLVLLRLAAAVGVTTPKVSDAAGIAADAGMLTASAWRWRGHDVMTPVFITQVDGDRYTIAPVGSALPPGSPLYSLQGELLAIAGPTSGTPCAFSARAAATRLIARAASPDPDRSLGARYQTLQPALIPLFGERGVLIADVVHGGPADVAALQAGDVLLSIDGTDVQSTDDILRSLQPAPASSPRTLRVRRNGRVREVQVMAAPTFDVAALARAGSGEDFSLPEAHALFERSVLDSAHIPSTARVVALNGRAVSSRADADRALRAARGPVPILLRQQGTQFFAAIEAGHE